MNATEVMKSCAAVLQMRSTGLPDEFAAAALKLALDSEGAADLLAMWHQTDDAGMRDAIIMDLQDLLDDAEEVPKHPVQKPYMHFDRLQPTADAIRTFKSELKRKVDKWGGVSNLARATGIPQPSLSRFFNTVSMPRRTTLFKIAKAVGIPDEEIAFDHIW